MCLCGLPVLCTHRYAWPDGVSVATAHLKSVCCAIGCRNDRWKRMKRSCPGCMSSSTSTAWWIPLRCSAVSAKMAPSQVSAGLLFSVSHSHTGVLDTARSLRYGIDRTTLCPRHPVNQSRALIWALIFDIFLLGHFSPTSKLYLRWLAVPYQHTF